MLVRQPPLNRTKGQYLEKQLYGIWRVPPLRNTLSALYARATEGQLLREVPALFARGNMILSKYWDSNTRRQRLRLFRKIHAERSILLLPSEACQIMSLVEAINDVPGDLAELGVASGASAKIIAAYAPDRIFHLFDTFDGLPEPSSADSSHFRSGQFRYSLDDVQLYLNGPNFRFHRGLFPESAKDLDPVRFAFVHLDADLYESTKAGLEWFYPRMNRGGILISHDYDTSAGINRAFREFFADKPEPYFDLVGSQCMFVKA